MATMKVTNVVDNGSLSDVPSAISAAASTRLTDPRTRSNAAPPGIMLSSTSKRRASARRSLTGVTLLTHVMTDRVHRTSRRAIRDDPNISSPAS